MDTKLRVTILILLACLGLLVMADERFLAGLLLIVIAILCQVHFVREVEFGSDKAD